MHLNEIKYVLSEVYDCCCFIDNEDIINIQKTTILINEAFYNFTTIGGVVITLLL